MTLAAVVVGTGAPSAWTLRCEVGAEPATLEPLGLRLTPQALEAEEFTAVVDLVETTGREETAPAPWWWPPDRQPPDPPPDNVTYLDSTLPGWGEALDAERRSMIMTAIRSGEDPMAPRHPLLRLLGPIDLQARRRRGAAAGVSPVPGVLRLAAGESRHHGPGHGRRARRRRGHPPVEHEPAPDLARRPPGRRALPAGRLQRSDHAQPRGELGLAAGADPHGEWGEPGRRRQSAGGARPGPRCPAGRRRTRPVALGGGAADRHDLLRTRRRRRAGRARAGRW